MADKKFRGRDKIVQKMTKDGLVDENLRTGEQKSATAAEKPEQEDSAKETAEKETDKEPVMDEEICMDAEDGASLKAAGYTCEGRAGGLEWNGAKAPKQADQYPRQMKTRWVKKKEGLHGS